MDRDPVDGVELRPVRLDEIPVVGELVRRAEAHDGVPRVLADEELEQDLTAEHLALELDTQVAVCAGVVVGWAYLWHPPATARLDRAELIGEVDPDHRGQGVGRALLGWSVDRARQRLAGRDHDLPRFLRVGAYDWQDDRLRLYQRFGFEVVTWSDELLRPLDEVPTVPVPDGVSLVPWPDDRDEELLDLRNAAFADHRQSTVVDPETWDGFVRGHGGRTDLSVIAVDDASGAAIGLCLNQVYPEDEAVTGRRDAWIANLATAQSVRGRGVAGAMIGWSLAAFAAAGYSHAVLEVDTDNPTGAPQLYRRLGFESLHRNLVHERELPA